MLRHHRGSLALATMALALTGAATAIAAVREDPHAQIAFRRFLDLDNATGAIFVADAHGRHDRQLTTPLPDGLDDQPSWTPSGRRIVFTRQPGGDSPDTHREFWTVRADGSDARLLSPACPDGPPRCAINEQRNEPRYSPDGRQISFGWAAGEVREDINQIEFSELYVMNANGSHPHALTAFSTDHPFAGDTGDASWSPDSRRLVLSHLNSPLSDPAGGRALFVINRDGTRLRQLTPWDLRAAGRGAWFPDGRTIAFHTLPPDDGPGGDIYTIRADGTDIRRLTHFAPGLGLGELAISPDGRRIVFSQGPDKRDLFVMHADGTHIRQITETAVSENWPDWRPFS
jgi:TolB protein